MYEIYVITNRDNGKIYVGQTCQGVLQRWHQHKSAARSGVDTYFYRAIRSHGEEAFSIEIVEEVETLEQANEAERQWIAVLESIDSCKGYNGTHGGDGSMPTDLTRQKIGEKCKERWENPEYASRMSAANTGKHHTPEGRANISKGSTGNHKLGTTQSAESRAKTSATLKLAFAEGRRKKTGGIKKGTILGPMSEEIKAKISAGVSKVRKEVFWSTRKKEAEMASFQEVPNA